MEDKVTFNYITTNLINGKQYIGVHTTNNCNDNYFGSGNAIRAAIKKYGKSNFKREILCYVKTNIEGHNNEEKYIKEYNTLQPNGYNLSPSGGLSYNGFHSQYSKDMIGKKNKGKIRKSIEHLTYDELINIKIRNNNQLMCSIDFLKCKNCNKIILVDMRRPKTFCSQHCINTIRWNDPTFSLKKIKVSKIKIIDLYNVLKYNINITLKQLAKQLNISTIIIKSLLKPYDISYKLFKKLIRQQTVKIRGFKCEDYINANKRLEYILKEHKTSF